MPHPLTKLECYTPLYCCTPSPNWKVLTKIRLRSVARKLSAVIESEKQKADGKNATRKRKKKRNVYRQMNSDTKRNECAEKVRKEFVNTEMKLLPIWCGCEFMSRIADVWHLGGCGRELVASGLPASLSREIFVLPVTRPSCPTSRQISTSNSGEYLFGGFSPPNTSRNAFLTETQQRQTLRERRKRDRAQT
jgi:hypothetical protein